jgi:predicted nucleotidyltransferase
MWKRLAILGSFLAAALWAYFWEFVRSWIYERVLGMIEPYAPSYDVALRYGPSLVLVVVGVWLFFRAKTPPQRFAPATVAALEDADLKKTASKWLIAKLSDRKLYVQHLTLFGSIVHDHFRTSDVDVIVRFRPVSDAKIARAVRSIKGTLADQFKQIFGHDLHIKFFCADEKSGYEAFIASTKHEEIT